MGYANKVIEFNGTTLYKTPLLSIDELNKIPEMCAVEITRQEFESFWEQAVLAGYENQGEN